MVAPSSAGFRRLLPLLKPYKRELLAGGICMLLFVASWPLLAAQVGQLIPAIGDGDFPRVLRVIAVALSLFLLQKLAQFGQDTLLADPALHVTQALRRQSFARLQRLGFGALETLSAGDLTYRLTEDADRIGEVIYKNIQETVPSILQLVVMFGYMISLDWQLSLATLLLAPLVAVLVSSFAGRVLTAAERSQKQVSELAGLLGEAISGLPLVRAFAAEPWLQQRFEEEIEQHRRARYRTMRLLALQHPVVGFIEAAGILAILLIGALRISAGGLSGAGFSSFIAALLILIDPISRLINNFNEFQQGQASLGRLREIEREPIEEPDRPNAQPMPALKGALDLRDVSFAYEPGKPVLQQLNLRVEPGQVVALVGPSGAGKPPSSLSCFASTRPSRGNCCSMAWICAICAPLNCAARLPWCRSRALSSLARSPKRFVLAAAPAMPRCEGLLNWRMPPVSLRRCPRATTHGWKSAAATSPAVNCSGLRLPARCSVIPR